MLGPFLTLFVSFRAVVRAMMSRGVLLLSLFYVFETRAEEFDLPTLAKRTMPAIVLLDVRDANGESIATATGFWVSNDGKLVTNHHVIENAASVFAREFPEIRNERSGRAADLKCLGVLAENKTWDLAILQFKTVRTQVLKLGSAAATEIGERIAVIGNPHGFDRTVSDGIVSSKRGEPDGVPALQLTAPVSPGSSGSPVLNRRGEVVGIVALASVSPDWQALNFAVPAEAASMLLERAESVRPRALAKQPSQSGKGVRRDITLPIRIEARKMADLLKSFGLGR